MTQRSLSDRLMSIPRQALYILLFLVVGYPILFPIGLPLTVNPTTIQLTETFDALPEGSVLFMNTDHSPLGHVEVTPQNIAVIRQLIKKKVKLVCASFIVAEGALWPPIIFEALSTEVEQYDYEYGVDYVFLGFLPGGATSISAFSAEIRSIVNSDYYGTPLDEIPLMEDLYKITDFDLCYITGSAGLGSMISQMQTPYDMPMVMCTMAVDYSGMVKYIDSGQILGLTSGLRGAAEIEKVYGTPGAGTSSMDVLSTSHMLVIALILVGNIGFFLSKMEEK